MTEDVDVILRKLRDMDETLTELHRILMVLHEQWTKPSDMTDAIEEAMKSKAIKPPRRIVDPEA